MLIVWDEPKRLANMDKHGFDFATLSLDYFASATIFAVRQHRLAAIGRLDGKAMCVVFVPMGAEALSVISMRPASARERTMLREH
jgi:uncharacterized DUF497 family protein